MNIYINLRQWLIGMMIVSVAGIILLHTGISLHSMTSHIFRKTIRM